MKTSNNRRGFKVIKPTVEVIENPKAFEIKSNIAIYASMKMTHSGVTCWKTFDGFSRKMNKNSLTNLLNQLSDEIAGKSATTELRETRKLNECQSRKIKGKANKLAYYSQVRVFTSRKSGNYKFKVGFLTLTAPEGTTNSQFIKAFQRFLEYLHRTANCEYVWKKELGEKTGKLHVHIMINNFIPYYVINWKWKRALLRQGVKWPKTEKGKDTESHYRIELPRSRKLIAHYIAKYMAKAYEIPRECGYVAGHSEGLELCKEQVFIEAEISKFEIADLQKAYRTIRDCFLSHTCVDLRKLGLAFKELKENFEQQFALFQSILTRPQKFYYC